MDGGNAIIWTAHESANEIIGIVAAAGGTPVAVGGPDARSIAAALHDDAITVFDDLRATLMEIKPSVALITTGLGGGDSALDGRTASELRAAGVVVLSTVAPAPGLIEAGQAGLFKETGGTTPAAVIRLAPRLRRHPSYRAAEDVFTDFGRANMVTAEAFAPAHTGGAASAMLLALDAIQTLFGLPELVDAAAARPTKRLSDLDGSAAALLRFADGRCGQFLVSDRAPWGWRITLSGDSGRLTIRPSGFDWVDADGTRRDSTRTDAAASGFTNTLADAIRNALAGSHSGEPATDWVGLLSTAEAVLLSSRTGEPESPGTIARAAEMPGV